MKNPKQLKTVSGFLFPVISKPAKKSSKTVTKQPELHFVRSRRVSECISKRNLKMKHIYSI